MKGRAAPAPERYWFFAGKGGVGKTTCAAAAAAAQAAAGQRVLLVSVDPAHSLGDALGRPLSPRPRPVAIGRGRLWAAELDADAALDRWLRARRGALERIVARGTYLDDDDVDALLRLSMPGVDELIGLIELTRLGRERPYDGVVVDTAPTGHLLRLLQMPEALRRMAAVLDDMHAKHRYLADSLGGGYRPDVSDAVIEEIEREGLDLGALVRDGRRCRLSWVLVPEQMALAEARDGVAELAQGGVRVQDLVINRLTPPAPGCAPCRRRAAHERAVVAGARRGFPGLPLRWLPALPGEPRGLAALSSLGRRLRAAPRVVPPWRHRADRPTRPGRVARQRATTDWLAALAPPGTRLLLFAGKGGVGKTTCATATALALAARAPSASVLLMSVDPAHSVGDALGVALGPEARRVPGTALDAREVDSGRLFAARHRRYVRAVDRAFDAVMGGSRFDASLDRAVMAKLIDLAPPGFDELLGLLEIGAAVRGRPGAPGPRTVVVDTAPTGHTLRLLAMPGIGLEWVHTFMALWLKYRSVIGLGELGWDLVALSRELKDLQALFADGRRTRVVAVTRPGQLPLAETRRLIAGLRARRLTLSGAVVNAVPAGPSGCAHAAGSDAASRRSRADLLADLRHAGAPAPAVVEAPLAIPPPRGPAGLARWARGWRRVT